MQQSSVVVRPHSLKVADGTASVRAAASRARHSQARGTLKRVLAYGPFHILAVQESIARVVAARAAARPRHRSPVPEKLTSARDDRAEGGRSLHQDMTRSLTILSTARQDTRKKSPTQDKLCTGQGTHARVRVWTRSPHTDMSHVTPSGAC